MRCCERGRSMIEMLGVLAIVGVLSVGGISGYSKAMAKVKRDRLISEISETVIGIRTLYFQQKNFSTISTTALARSRVIPSEMYEENDINNDPITLTHALNGEVLVFPSNGSDENDNLAFEIYMLRIDKHACIALTTMDWGADPASGFKGMYIGTEDISEAKMKQVYSNSDQNPSAGIYTPGQHETSVPLQVPLAHAACACPQDTCVVGFKYI